MIILSYIFISVLLYYVYALDNVPHPMPVVVMRGLGNGD